MTMTERDRLSRLKARIDETRRALMDVGKRLEPLDEQMGHIRFYGSGSSWRRYARSCGKWRGRWKRRYRTLTWRTGWRSASRKGAGSDGSIQRGGMGGRKKGAENQRDADGMRQLGGQRHPEQRDLQDRHQHHQGRRRRGWTWSGPGSGSRRSGCCWNARK